MAGHGVLTLPNASAAQVPPLACPAGTRKESYPMSDKVRLGIIGTGGIAGSHLGGYKALVDAGYTQFEIAALADVNDEQRARFAAKVEELFGNTPAQFRSAEELAEMSDVVAVDICTPHAFHHTAAIPCLEAGLDVMVEKPCGITIKATDRILQAAAKKNRIVAVAEQVRRGIKSRCMSWAVNEAKMIGDPRFLSVMGLGTWDFAEVTKSYAMQWRMLKLLTGGGMIFDAGAHFADMMYYLFGDVVDVYAWLGCFQDITINSTELGPRPMDVEDTWTSVIRFKSGMVANWTWSFATPGEPVAAQILYGSGGSAHDRGGWMHTFQNGADLTLADGTKKSYEEIEKEYRAQLSPETREALFPYGVENDFALECWDFIDSVQKRRKPEIDAETTKWTKSICLAAYESSVCGKPVTVRDVHDGKVSAYQDPINEYWGI